MLKDGAATYTPGASERRGTTSKFLHGDALSSTRLLTDTSQSATDTVLYDAFGLVVARTGSTPTPFGFGGGWQYQADGDSGLLLLGHRYYDPSLGRFLSADPSGSGDNWYAYCENNPLNGVDPLGLQRLGARQGQGGKKPKPPFPNGLYPTLVSAGKAAGNYYYPISVERSQEIGLFITYTPPQVLAPGVVGPPKPGGYSVSTDIRFGTSSSLPGFNDRSKDRNPRPENTVAWFHTHPDVEANRGRDLEHFSNGDIGTSYDQLFGSRIPILGLVQTPTSLVIFDPFRDKTVRHPNPQ